jgi:tetratricopeptide (TPR) repeat protein
MTAKAQRELSIYLAMLVSIACPKVFGFGYDVPPYYEFQDQANHCRETNDFNGAVDSYNRALEAAAGAPSRDRAFIFFNRGLIFDLQGRSLDANRDFQSAVKLCQEYLKQNPKGEDSFGVNSMLEDIRGLLALKQSFDSKERTYLKAINARRWSADKTPLHVCIESNGSGGFNPDQKALIMRAFNEWTSAGVRLRCVPVSDDRAADIVIVRVETVGDTLPDEAGSTMFETTVDENGREEVSKARVRLSFPSVSSSELPQATIDNMYAAALHQTGRALGLDGCSPNGSDAMYWKSASRRLSERDKATIRQLYE